VDSVELKLEVGEIQVRLAHREMIDWPCPECGTACKLYDHQPEREWRHLDITNATSESINAKIQWVKYTARGFRNKQNFVHAIYFHCGGLDLAREATK
jgi:transposase